MNVRDPVDSSWLAMFTVSPTIQYLGDLVPTTPATTAPIHTTAYTLVVLKACPHCRRKVRQSPIFVAVSPFSATVALFCDSVDKWTSGRSGGSKGPCPRPKLITVRRKAVRVTIVLKSSVFRRWQWLNLSLIHHRCSTCPQTQIPDPPWSELIIKFCLNW